MNILTITNAETFVSHITHAVTVEEMTGVGVMIKKTRGTAVFPQEAISVPKIVITSIGTMLTARQEYYYPGPNHAMVPVPAVQRSRRTTVNMTA